MPMVIPPECGAAEVDALGKFIALGAVGMNDPQPRPVENPKAHAPAAQALIGVLVITGVKVFVEAAEPVPHFAAERIGCADHKIDFHHLIPLPTVLFANS